MDVFCDRLKLCSKAAPNCQTDQNKGRYREQERSFLLVSLAEGICNPYYLPIPEFSPITSLLHNGHSSIKKNYHDHIIKLNLNFPSQSIKIVV